MSETLERVSLCVFHRNEPETLSLAGIKSNSAVKVICNVSANDAPGPNRDSNTTRGRIRNGLIIL